MSENILQKIGGEYIAEHFKHESGHAGSWRSWSDQESRLPAQAAEPAVRQVQMHFFTQTPFRADTKSVTDDQHTNHQLGINGGAPRVTVAIGKMFAQSTKVKKPVISQTGRSGLLKYSEHPGVDQMFDSSCDL